MKIGRKAADPKGRAKATGRQSATRTRTVDGPARQRRTAESTSRAGRARSATPARRPREARGLKQGPQTAPTPHPIERQARAKTTSQAKARSKARKAKAPRVVRPPLRERLMARLVALDLRPQRLATKVPFVVVIIAALGIGLGVTLWLSTAAAERSYQLGSARSTNSALSQQKEALERDVLEAESAPALAEAARNLGMIPSKDTAHLVQDAAGNWVVIGQAKPAEGTLPPPLNAKLPDEKPPAPASPSVPGRPTAPLPMPGSSAEVPVRLTPLNTVPVPGASHAPSGATLPGPVPGLILPPAVSVAPQTPLMPQNPLVPQTSQLPQAPLVPQAPLAPLAPLVAGAENLAGAIADVLPPPVAPAAPPIDAVPVPGLAQ